MDTWPMMSIGRHLTQAKQPNKQLFFEIISQQQKQILYVLVTN